MGGVGFIPFSESLSSVNTSRFVTTAGLIHSLSSPPLRNGIPLSSELVNKGTRNEPGNRVRGVLDAWKVNRTESVNWREAAAKAKVARHTAVSKARAILMQSSRMGVGLET